MQRWDAGLTAVQKAFVREFVELGAQPRLATLAACRAGVPQWRASNDGADLLASPEVLAALPLYREQRAVMAAPTHSEVMATLAAVMRNETAPARDRVGAARALAGILGVGPEAVARVRLLEAQAEAAAAMSPTGDTLPAIVMPPAVDVEGWGVADG